ncbi:hypothetical protein ACVW0I_004819 [Bradyrhizobium sp. LM6.11]
MPDHQDIRVHGVQRHRGVDQRLALFHGRRGHRHIHDIGAQPFAGEFERGLGPGGSLEEEVHLRPSTQDGALLVNLAVDLDIFFGQVEEAGDVGRGKALDAQQMPVAEDEGRFRCH